MRFVAVGSLIVAWGVASCVSDTIVPNDGGADASLDTNAPDVADAAKSDAADAADTGPVVDGGYAFGANWPTYSNSGEGAETVAALPSGGFAIAGSYSGNFALVGPYPLPAAGGVRDAYVATLDSSGKVTAALGFGGSGSDTVLSIATDPAGDIYIVGLTFAGLTLNGKSLPTGTFIAKLDGKNIAAAPIWTRSFEFTVACNRCLTMNAGVLGLGTVFGGFGPGTINYDTAKSVTSHGGFDVLLMEMDPANGNVKWGGQIGGANDDVVDGLALDAKGALYLVGDTASASFAPNEALGTKNPTGPGTTRNLFVAKLDASQAAVYAYAYGDPGGTTLAGNGIAVDGAGRVAVAASFSGGVDFGMGVTGAASADAIAFVIDETKNKTVWQQVIGDTGGDGMRGVAFDAWGHLLMTGSYQKTPQIGATKLPASGTLGAFLAKVGPPPTYTNEWAVGFVQTSDSGASIATVDVAVTPSGTSIICGGFGGATDFGNGAVTAISTGGTADTFVAGRIP